MTTKQEIIERIAQHSNPASKFMMSDEVVRLDRVLAMLADLMPSDHVLVPAEPTEAMIKAAQTYRNESCCYGECADTLIGQHKAMIGDCGLSATNGGDGNE